MAPELVGQTVERPADVVVADDQRMALPRPVVPPTRERCGVGVQVVVDGVEVAGRVELVEGSGHVSVPEMVCGRPVLRIRQPVAVGELGDIVGMAFADHPEHAAGCDRAVLGGVTDEPEGGACAVGEPAEPVAVAVVEASSTISTVRASSGEWSRSS